MRSAEGPTPVAGYTARVSASTSVDFPAPFGPNTATRSPSSMRRLSRSRAVTPSRSTVTWSNSMSGSDMGPDDSLSHVQRNHAGRVAGVVATLSLPPSALLRTIGPMPARAPHSVAMVAFSDAQILDVVGPLEVFSRAARLLSDEGRRGPSPYTVEILARSRGTIVTSSGIGLVVNRSFRQVRSGIDTLFVAGGRGVDAALHDHGLIRWLQRISQRVSRLASVCTGAFVLAEAGLLDGKRAATHWGSCLRLAERYPQVSVDVDPIFVRQDRIYTSAGVTAGMDLALALVEEDHGPQVARQVARELVLFLKRPGGQSQFSAQLQTRMADRAPLADLQSWMADHLGADLSVDALARRVSMSPRNFARVFARSAGVTPARYVEKLRVEGGAAEIGREPVHRRRGCRAMRLRHARVDAPLVPAHPARESDRISEPFRE